MIYKYIVYTILTKCVSPMNVRRNLMFVGSILTHHQAFCANYIQFEAHRFLLLDGRYNVIIFPNPIRLCFDLEFAIPFEPTDYSRLQTKVKLFFKKNYCFCLDQITNQVSLFIITNTRPVINIFILLFLTVIILTVSSGMKTI